MEKTNLLYNANTYSKIIEFDILVLLLAMISIQLYHVNSDGQFTFWDNMCLSQAKA